MPSIEAVHGIKLRGERPDEHELETQKKTKYQMKWNRIAIVKNTALILGAALIFSRPARTSITWNFAIFWGASRSFCEDKWNRIYVTFGESDWLLCTVGAGLVSLIVYWTVSLSFLYVDMTGRPACLFKCKIQQGKNIPVEWNKLTKAIKVCVFNQFLGVLVTPLLYRILKWRGSGFTAALLPSFQWFIWEIIVFVLSIEISFYYFHRLFHHPRIYKHVHKIHHEWTAPIALVAFYAHPIEHIVATLTPAFLGPILMGSHIAVLWVWICIAQTSTITTHSGYNLPLLLSPEAHDFHHLNFTSNFGVLGIFDRLHGTDTLFLKTKCYDHHSMLLGATSSKGTTIDNVKNRD